MPGIADLFYFGQPSPQQQIAQFLSGQQPGGPAQGAGPPGLPPSPTGPAAPAAQDQTQQQTPSPGDPAPQGSAPQPTALQSTPQMNASYQALANPPNLMSLYLQLQQRQSASDQINHGLALIAANHAGNPAMARAIMDSANAGGNAAGQVGDLMQLYQSQQAMVAQQQLMAQAPALAAKLGMDEGTVRSMILAGRGPELVKSLEPTDQMRNYQQARDAYAKNHPGASPDDIETGAQSILLGMGGGGAVGGDMRAMNIARSQWLNDPANKDKPPPGYLTDVTKWKIYSQDLSDAKSQFGGVNDSLTKFMGDMSEVANDDNLEKITGGITGGLQGLLPGDIKNLKVKMEGLQNEAKDMASRGGPKGVNQNLKTLGSSPEDFTNLGITDYRGNVIAPRMRQALTAQANANGAAGQANSMPGYLQHYLDQMYKPGGDLDIGGSPKVNAPDTGPDGKPLPQPTKADLDVFYKNLERRGPERALAQLKADGIDTSSLR